MAITVEFPGCSYTNTVVGNEQLLEAAEAKRADLDKQRDAIDKSIADLKAAIEKKAAEAKKTYARKAAEEAVTPYCHDGHHIGLRGTDGFPLYLNAKYVSASETLEIVRRDVESLVNKARRDAFTEAANAYDPGFRDLGDTTFESGGACAVAIFKKKILALK